MTDMLDTRRYPITDHTHGATLAPLPDLHLTIVYETAGQ
jgi:hypothetical protein